MRLLRLGALGRGGLSGEPSWSESPGLERVISVGMSLRFDFHSLLTSLRSRDAAHELLPGLQLSRRPCTPTGAPRRGVPGRPPGATCQ